MHRQPLHTSCWVKDWKAVFRVADPENERVVLGHPRYRRTPFDDCDPEAVEAVLDIRDNPPHYCTGAPGANVIKYELQERFAGTDVRYPSSTSTIWKILDQHQRIIRAPKREHRPVDLPTPMHHWEIDFADIPTVPADPEGKQQHAAEMFNVIDRGTSILLESTARGDYTAETSIIVCK